MNYIPIQLIFRDEVERDVLGNPCFAETVGEKRYGRLSSGWMDGVTLEGRDVTQSAPEVLIYAPFIEMKRAVGVCIGDARFRFLGAQEVRPGEYLASVERWKNDRKE